MTWKLRGAYKPETIANLLKDGWEPFSVNSIHLSSADRRVNRQVEKIYFRKKDKEEETVAEIVSELRGFLEASINRIEKMIEEAKPFQHTIIPGLPSGSIKIHVPDDTGLITSESFSQAEESFSVKEELVEETEQEENPHGYKVIDEVPSVESARTSMQDRAIDGIRKSSKTNITVNPIASDGSVSVLVGSLKYIITSSGEITEEDTGARTNSLAV